MAIAWVLSRGEDVVPLVGARTRERLAESLGAIELELSADDLAASARRGSSRPRFAEHAQLTSRNPFRCNPLYMSPNVQDHPS